MADDLNALVHDASSVFRFVDFICQFCYRQEHQQAYGEASSTFFTYVGDLGKSTKDQIQVDIEDAKSDVALIAIYRTNLATIKQCWARVHEFVKLVADGHALQTPMPLLVFMEQQLSELAKLQDSKIVILISEELNYLQYQHSRLKNFATDLGLTLIDGPKFPEKLAFIAIPFSQSDAAFTNTLIYHELAHFVFEELNKRQELDPHIDAALTAQLATKYTGMQPKEKRWYQNRIATWAEEVFCDLFALWLIGPAYSFASIELLSLLDVLDKDSAKEFDSEHPCFAFRFNEHKEQLNAQGWWAAIKDLNCEHPRLIEEMASINPVDYTSFPHEPLFDTELIPAFLRLRPEIRRLVKTTVGNRDAGLNAFVALKSGIDECLSNGIVPSVLHGRGEDPLPLALINAAFVFYLQSLSALIEAIDGPGPMDIEHRSDISRRLEMWVLKAIEDCNLLTRYSKNRKRTNA